jgi:hypothetical protein
MPPMSADEKERRRAANKAKEKHKLAEVDAALPDNEKLLSAARVWDTQYFAQVSLTRQKEYDMIRGWFLDFVTDESLNILGVRCSVEEAKKYFLAPPQAKVVTTKVLRMFLEYLAKSRTGRIPR